MLTKYVLPGDRVELMMVKKDPNTNDEINNRIYKSRVNELLSEERLEIMMPIEKTKLILLPVDEEFDVYFYTKSGLYQCFAIVKDRYKKENIYILVLELVSNLRKYQRRQYFRLSCALDISTRKLEEEELETFENSKQHLVPGIPLQQSLIVDISGGGLRFIADFEYELNSLVYLKCQLYKDNQPKDYVLVGKVLFTQP